MRDQPLDVLSVGAGRAPGRLQSAGFEPNPAEAGELLARIGGAFFLDATTAVSDAFDGDLVRGLVLLTIIRQSVHEAPGTVVDIRTKTAGKATPAGGARPVTIYAVAKALGLNYETTRRHVKRLVDDGYCVRQPEGFIAPPETADRPEIVRFTRRLTSKARQMCAHLRTAGIGGY